MTDGDERSKRRVLERGAVRSAAGLPAQPASPEKAEAPAAAPAPPPAGAPPASSNDRLTRMRLLRAQSSSLVQRVQSDLAGARDRAEAETRSRMHTEEGREALAQEHAGLAARLADLERTLAERDALAATRETDVGRLRASLDGAQAELAELKGKLVATEAAVEATAKETGQLAAARGDLETTVTRVQDELKTRDEQLAGAQELVGQRERDLRDQRAAFVEREKTFTRSVSGLEAQARVSERALAEERARAEGLLEEATAQAQRLERESADHHEREEQWTREKDDLRRQLEEAVATNATERKATEASKAWLLAERQRADRLQVERQQQQEQRTAAERRTGELETQLRELAGATAAKDAAHAELQERFTRLEAAKRTTEDELAHTRGVMRALSDTLERLTLQHQELEAAFNEVTDSYEELHANIERLSGRGASGA